MIITLYGNNDYLIDRELNRLISKSDTELSVTKIYALDADLQTIKSELNSYSLFTSQRVIVLFEPSVLKGFDDYIVTEQIDEPDDLIVIIEHSLDKRTSYYRFLEKKTDFHYLTKLTELELLKWIDAYVKENGGSLSKDDARYLVDRVGDNQLLISKEIDKLIIYSNLINRQTIDLLCEPLPSSTIFGLLDSAFSFNPKKALTIYQEQRLQKVGPEQILAMLSWQLNNLAIYFSSKNLSQAKILSISGLSPYTLSKAAQLGSKLTLLHVKKFINELAILDFESKTKNLDLDEGLKNFIVSLSS